jgi:hypothetical protein
VKALAYTLRMPNNLTLNKGDITLWELTYQLKNSTELLITQDARSRAAASQLIVLTTKWRSLHSALKAVIAQSSTLDSQLSVLVNQVGQSIKYADCSIEYVVHPFDHLRINGLVSCVMNRLSLRVKRL